MGEENCRGAADKIPKIAPVANLPVILSAVLGVSLCHLCFPLLFNAGNADSITSGQPERTVTKKMGAVSG
jgi:hypothetical protein